LSDGKPTETSNDLTQNNIMNWIEEANYQVDNHGLPKADYSNWGFTTVNGAINTFRDYAMTKGSHPDGRMTVEEVQSLLLWILSRHKHNFMAEFNRKTSDLSTIEALDIIANDQYGKKWNEIKGDKDQRIRVLELAFIVIEDLKNSYKHDLEESEKLLKELNPALDDAYAQFPLYVRIKKQLGKKESDGK
jgi:hypothetical protein